jgi:hypothetical protein
MIGLDSNVILRAITGDDPVLSLLAFSRSYRANRPGVVEVESRNGG